MSGSAVQQYKELSTVDSLDIDVSNNDDIEDSALFDEQEDFNKIVVIRNEKPFPISRPPPQPRDWTYALAFVIHFIFILLLSLVEQNSLQHSLINYSRGWSWASMLMIITLVGSFIGAVFAFVIGVESIREMLFTVSIPFSFILKISLGNILLIMRSAFSLVGIAIIISAFFDTLWYRSARESARSITPALVQIAIDYTGLYGISFFLACTVIVSCQTCILLWWGAFFIGLISTVSVAYAAPLITIMFLSLAWITQFFHGLIAFIVGGCVLWEFVRDEKEQLLPTSRLLLYVRCALTTGLGSICKGALLTPLAHSILGLQYWVGLRQQEGDISRRCSTSKIVSIFLTDNVVDFAERHHRLAYSLSAIYGRAFSVTAHEFMASHSDIVDIAVEDNSQFILNCTSVVLSGLIAIIFGLFAERGEGSLWPLFFLVCFFLAHSGVSLSIHVYATTIDALIVASAISPVKFAKENQIVYLRFLRNSESGLR